MNLQVIYRTQSLWITLVGIMLLIGLCLSIMVSWYYHKNGYKLV
ncbi:MULTISPECIES: hypothetical protein [unclassified Candidatus Cardinium]|nr:MULTISPECIES: hypothetical protein [unclassified Candidatus Cardinium]